MIKFDIKDGKLIVKAQDLTIPVFKEIYERDTSKLKTTAIKELMYIYHMADPSSPYADMEVANKSGHIKKAIFKESKVKLDELVMKGIDEYMECNIDATDRVIYEFNNKIDDLRKQIMNDKLTSDNVDDIIDRMKNFDKLLEVKEKLEARQAKAAVVSVRGKMKLSYQEQKALGKIK
jgi:hypothetical protein